MANLFEDGPLNIFEDGLLNIFGLPPAWAPPKRSVGANPIDFDITYVRKIYTSVAAKPFSSR